MIPETTARVEAVREKVWAAVRAHLARGGRMQAGVWGVNRVPVPGKPGATTWVPRVDSDVQGCCPLGAVLLGQEASDTNQQPWAGIDVLGQVLGLTDPEGCAFMAGYDGRPLVALAGDPWYQLGRAARLEFGP